TSPILLDGSIDKEYESKIKSTIESDADNLITDMHVWKVSANHYAAIISLVTQNPKPTQYYKDLLQDYHKLAHITIEVNACEGETCESVKI
ncbi:MAG: cation transporter, partial [Gammaproteobacteria bacterium]|nr:cation transporter [Gammaproteobacteria bacterium]